MTKRVAVAAGALLLMACDPPTLPPRLANEIYEFRLPTAPSAVLRWPSGSTIRVFVHGGTHTARAALLDHAFETGARIWNERAFYAEYRLVRAASVRAADVVLRWSDEPPPVVTSGCVPSLGLGVTTFCLNTADPAQIRLHVFPLLPPETGASSVRMIVTILAAEGGDRDRVSRLVAHELGHVLGLTQHSRNEQDLMYGGELLRAALSVRDAATVQILYRTRPDIVP